MSIDVWRRHLLINSLLLVCLHKLLPMEERPPVCLLLLSMSLYKSVRAPAPVGMAAHHSSAASAVWPNNVQQLPLCCSITVMQVLQKSLWLENQVSALDLKAVGPKFIPTNRYINNALKGHFGSVLRLCASACLWTFTSCGLSFVAHQREIKGIKIFVPMVIKARKGEMTSCIFLQTSKSRFERTLCASGCGLQASAGGECDARKVCFLLLQASSKDSQKKITFSSDSHIFLWKTYITVWEDKQCQMVQSLWQTENPDSCELYSRISTWMWSWSTCSECHSFSGGWPRWPPEVPSNPNHPVTVYRN